MNGKLSIPIFKLAKINASWEKPPSADAVREKDHQRLLSDPNWSIPVKEKEIKFLEELKTIYSADQIALAYIRLYESRQSSPEELDDISRPDKSDRHSDFGDSVWFSLAMGRNKGADPRSLLPMICNGGGISKNDIGAIRIQSNQTFFELKKACVEVFLSKVGPNKKLEDRVQFRQLDKTPVFETTENQNRSIKNDKSFSRKSEQNKKRSKSKKSGTTNRAKDGFRKSENKASRDKTDKISRDGAVTPLSSKKQRVSKDKSIKAGNDNASSNVLTRDDSSSGQRSYNKKKNFSKPKSKANDTSKRFSPNGKSFKARVRLKEV